MTRSAVALFVYNRIAYLPAILERVRAAHPTRLYIFGDGPKDDPEDRARCAAVRSLIVDMELPFPIELAFAAANLGTRRFVSAIDEVFACEERAIFLDDDVELSRSFFPYCDWLLETYEHERGVAMISGINPLSSWPTGGATCFFSKLGNAQAWATWRRAWRFYSGSLDLWCRLETRAAVADFLADPELFAWCAANHDRAREPPPDWDFQWELARHVQRALCAVPAKSLVIHRGRGSLATHVKTHTVLDAIAERHEIEAPFRKPVGITADHAFDRLYFEATQNKLSGRSARWLGERLMMRSHNLLAAAVLHHSSADMPPDPTTKALIEQAIARARLAAYSG
jgi:hypothetical protein